jgi:hypothetical protein
MRLSAVFSVDGVTITDSVSGDAVRLSKPTATTLEVASVTEPSPAPPGVTPTPAHGIVGCFSLLRGPYVALITDAKAIGCGPGGAIINSVSRVELFQVPGPTPPLTSAQLFEEAEYVCVCVSCGFLVFVSVCVYTACQVSWTASGRVSHLLLLLQRQVSRWSVVSGQWSVSFMRMCVHEFMPNQRKDVCGVICG